VNATKLGIFIGRFQPATVTHVDIIGEMLSREDVVFVLIGSTNVAPSPRNPFTFEERVAIIEAAFSEDERKRIYFSPLPDSAYDFQAWVKSVQDLVERKWLSMCPSISSVTLYGCKKDDSSYYLDYFPQWKYSAVQPRFVGVGKMESATQVREIIYGSMSCEIDVQMAKIQMVGGSYEKMIDVITKNRARFDAISSEDKFVRKYRAQWDGSPYPPTFVTVDAVVVFRGHVLVVRRGRNPGKGLYALPGGFLNVDELISDATVRELREETKIAVGSDKLKACASGTLVFDHPHRDPRGRTITHATLYNLDKIFSMTSLPEIKAADDAAEAEWMSLAKVDASPREFYADHWSIIKRMIGEVK
jgi:bifunctional NMN adenylyltransferase/nudix hydrolase